MDKPPFDDSLDQELENELKALLPSAPPARLKGRIQTELTLREHTPVAPSERLRASLARQLDPRPALRFPAWAWGPIAAAAVLAIGLILRPAPQTTQEATAPGIAAAPNLPAPPVVVATRPTLHPLAASRHFVSAEHLGIQELEGLGPVRMVRLHSLDRLEYGQEGKDRRVVVTRPREDIVYTQLVSY